MKSLREKFTSLYAVGTLDVWGNPIDGWEVNNTFRSGADIVKVRHADKSGPTDADIIRSLRRDGHIRKGIHAKSLDIDGDSDTALYVEDRRQPRLPAVWHDGAPDYGWGKPVFYLEYQEPPRKPRV